MVVVVTVPEPNPNPCPCLLCRTDCVKHVNDNRRVCQGHRDKTRRDLAMILVEYALLGEELAYNRSAGNGPKVSGSRAAPLPGNLDALTLRGPGALGNVWFAIDPETGELDYSKADPETGLLPEEDQHGQVPVFAALETWERDWRSYLGWQVTGRWTSLETALTAIVRFLDAQLDWACDHHPAIDEFAAELRGVVGSMRAARGDRPESIYVGRCPVGACGARLYADSWHDVIRCSACRTEWPQSQWVLLGRVMAG